MTKLPAPRLLSSAALFSTLFLAHSAHAQTPTPDLPIATPPGAVVQLEVDARQEDLLGMAKSLISGLQKSINSQPDLSRAMASGSVPVQAILVQSLLSQDISKILKNVNHVHLTVFTQPPGSTPLDVESFYESPWIKEGGHRMTWLNISPSQRALLVGFNEPQGFAAVIQSPREIIALRADGYPDLEALAPILVTAFQANMAIETRTATIVPPAMEAAPPQRPAVKPTKPKTR